MKRITFIIVLLSLFLFSFCRNTNSSNEQIAKIEDVLLGAEEIPFELYKDLIYFDVTVADSVKSKFIFDTGCSYLVLDSTLYANKFGRVDTLMKASTSGAGGQMEKCHLSKGIWKYQVGDVKHKIINAAVINLKKTIPHKDIGGIVGIPFMCDRNIIIDYYNSKIYLLNANLKNKIIGNSAHGHYVKQSGKALTPHIQLDLYINDSIKISGNFLLDIGSAYSISFTSKTSKEYNLEKVITDSKEHDGLAIGGSLTECLFLADSVSVAGYTLRNFEVSYRKGDLLDRNYIGSVGNQFLKNFNVQIDFKTGDVWLAPNSSNE